MKYGVVEKLPTNHKWLELSNNILAEKINIKARKVPNNNSHKLKNSSNYRLIRILLANKDLLVVSMDWTMSKWVENEKTMSCSKRIINFSLQKKSVHSK